MAPKKGAPRGMETLSPSALTTAAPTQNNNNNMAAAGVSPLPLPQTQAQRQTPSPAPNRRPPLHSRTHSSISDAGATTPHSVAGGVLTVNQLLESYRFSAQSVVEDAVEVLRHGEQGGPAATSSSSSPQPSAVAEVSSSSPPHSDAAAASPPQQKQHTATPSLAIAAAAKIGELVSLCQRRRRAATNNNNNKTNNSSSKTNHNNRTSMPITVDEMERPLRELIPLCKLVAMFCLETASESGILTSMRSRQTSGGATPATARSAMPTPRVMGGVRGGAAPPATPPRHADAAKDWLGNRMAAGGAAGAVANAPNTATGAFNDEQLVVQLLRPAIDVVASLTIILDDGSAPAGSTTSSAADPRELEHQLRAAAMWQLTAVLLRFPDAPFNAALFLPMLFPEADVRQGPQVRHPLLHPLLWSVSLFVRAAAANCIIALLHKLRPTLQYAEEPQPSRQSFVSLAAQGGAALLAIHQSLHWALQMKRLGGSAANTPTSARARRRGPEKGYPPVCSTASQLLSVYSATAVSTPYKRCPLSLAEISATLQLELLRQSLRDASSPEYAAATSFLAQIFRNESLRESISTIFAGVPSSASAGHHPPQLMDELLTHAADRVEVWRCLVHVARLYPKLVHTSFTALLTATVEVLRAVESCHNNPHNTNTSANTSNRGSAATTPTARRPVLHTPPPMRPSPTTAHGADGLDDLEGSQVLLASGASAQEASLAECLRAWLHFMGYVWRPFDGHAEDPGLDPSADADRATVAEKQAIFSDVLEPMMKMLMLRSELMCMVLRCIGQMGEDCMAALSPEMREFCRSYALEKVVGAHGRVRAEALNTLGMWSWQYPSMNSYGPVMVEAAATALQNESDAAARAKAAFALSNMAARLDDDGNVVRASPDHLSQLCWAAMRATSGNDDRTIQGHGIRMMHHLLKVMSFEELIEELEDECVVEAFLGVLISYLRPSARTDAKLRWNAACSLGTALSREVVFEAEPQLAATAVEELIHAVAKDRIFKVRTQAANALAKVPVQCLEDHATIVRGLCASLESCSSTDNFNQFREQENLRRALHTALSSMILTAPSSNEMEKVFATHKALLCREGLL